MDRSSDWRWRITFCAACGLFQSLGSSARLFSSARRACAVSQSKMPPQQRQGLADGFGEFLGFGAHGQPPEDLWMTANKAALI